MSASYTPAMKAAVCTRYGPPEVVVISEVEKPTTGDNGLLVKVHATTVNRTDCAYRAGKPFFMRFLTGLARPRSTVLGTEFAGVIEAIGSGVTSFGVGDKVFGYNEGPFGAHAEYLSVSEDGSVATMPANVTYQQAAPSTEGSHYALAHIRVAKIRSGQNILVPSSSPLSFFSLLLLPSLHLPHFLFIFFFSYNIYFSTPLARAPSASANGFSNRTESTSRRSWVLWPRIRSVRSSARCMAARRSCSPFRSTTN